MTSLKFPFKLRWVAFLLLSLLTLGTGAYALDAGSPSPLLIAAETRRFQFKEGFEHSPLDIVNTLQDNTVTRFQTLLEGLQQAYGMDKTLKGKGPYTLFASSDAAWKKIPSDDRMALFANKTQLKKVLSYHVVPGNFTSKALRTMSALKTLEGHELKVSVRGGNIYVDKSLVTVSDLPCSNGTIHVIDRPVMPPLSE